MAVKIRLARAGAKKAPFYRVVAADSRAPRDGRFIEILGRYNPRTKPSTVEIDLEKVDAWLKKGAQPTETAAKLIAIARGEKTYSPKPERKPAEAAPKAEEEPAAAAADEPAAEAEEPSAEAETADEPAAEEAE